MRHSAEHVLTMAMIHLYGDNIIMAMGPATDEGFYFDFDTRQDFKPTEDMFAAIEKEMQHIIDRDIPFEKGELSVEEARKLFEGNLYKQEWIDEIEKRGEKASIYKTGTFTDLCAGPHVVSTKHIGPFKLLSVAGAYWRGSEKNKMLTRIYGTCFPAKKELDDFLASQEEAKKQDHRKLGAELDLFAFSDLVGKGLPLWTPKGTTIRRILERYVVDEELKRGYLHVNTPELALVKLYETSGHYPYYKNTMYAPIEIDEEQFMLRPMTCPHHFELYKSRPRSYKELPVRYAELAKLFRYEKSGELTGLMRVRSFCLADAHIIATVEQATEEINRVLDLIDGVARDIGLTQGSDYRYRLSLGDRNDDKKYYKDDRAWDHAEKVLRDVLVARKSEYYEASNEAAFYGPKIDIQMKNISGKEETAFTVQYDFVMPKRFELRYTDTDGSEKEPIVIHRSSIGAIERTIAFLIERFAGAFPVWLAPVQTAILPIADRHIEYAKEVQISLLDAHIRVELDDRKESLPAKIRDARLQKLPYMVIIGDKEVSSQTISVRSRKGTNQSGETIIRFIAQIKAEVNDKVI